MRPEDRDLGTPAVEGGLQVRVAPQDRSRLHDPRIVGPLEADLAALRDFLALRDPGLRRAVELQRRVALLERLAPVEHEAVQGGAANARGRRPALVFFAERVVAGSRTSSAQALRRACPYPSNQAPGRRDRCPRRGRNRCRQRARRAGWSRLLRCRRTADADRRSCCTPDPARPRIGDLAVIGAVRLLSRANRPAEQPWRIFRPSERPSTCGRAQFQQRHAGRLLGHHHFWSPPLMVGRGLCRHPDRSTLRAALRLRATS